MMSTEMIDDYISDGDDDVDDVGGDGVGDDDGR